VGSPWAGLVLTALATMWICTASKVGAGQQRGMGPRQDYTGLLAALLARLPAAAKRLCICTQHAPTPQCARSCHSVPLCLLPAGAPRPGSRVHAALTIVAILASAWALAFSFFLLRPHSLTCARWAVMVSAGSRVCGRPRQGAATQLDAVQPRPTHHLWLL
jgi:hypothetical protein